MLNYTVNKTVVTEGDKILVSTIPLEHLYTLHEVYVPIFLVSIGAMDISAWHDASFYFRSGARETCSAATGTCSVANGACSGAKEACSGAKEACSGAKEACSGAKEACTGANESSLEQKEPALCQRYFLDH